MPLVEPTETSRAEVRELGSKFYGYVFPVNNPEALQINLDQLKSGIQMLPTSVMHTV
jgi:putative IMPACT (imprinted ancient) family translation regulator